MADSLSNWLALREPADTDARSQRLTNETVAAIGAAEQKRNRWTAAALWAIAILLAWLVWRVI